MGLPVFISPPSPQLTAKVVEKVAAPRSSIRRQRTVRGHGARPSAEARRRHVLGMTAGLPDASYTEYAVVGGQRISPSDDSEGVLARGHRIWNERMRLRDTLSFERQYPPSMDVDGPLMPPVPESRDYSSFDDRRREIERINIRDLRRLARRHPAPTPPYTETDITRLGHIGSESPRNATTSPSRYTPTGDVENIGQRAEEESIEFVATARRPPYHSGATRSELSERVQALSSQNRQRLMARRMRTRSALQMDGLGDRERSLSPDQGAAWETLLTSITPDPQPPSVGSSFVSTSASTGVTASGSGSVSANTSMTSLVMNEEARIVPDCDISESGSNDDDEDDDEDLYELRESRASGRLWRSYADVVTARADRASQRDRSGDIENLGGMQRIISRLAERDDIPEEWWAGAGLRREPSS
ncbi:hypothetical protein B0O99DRAFT_620618 [Bisporella sp. PMI_857]|nr:hypothetical protein B0O99DRAFT_620618 [Bisporella sp. PMI_857]